MELWNYGYGDIGESFGENRVVPFLRIAIVTAAKTLKLDIAHSEQRISSPPYTCECICTYIHTRTHASWCFRFYYANVLTRATWWFRKIRSEENDFSSFFLFCNTWHTWRSFLTIWHRVIAAVNLDWARSRSLFISGCRLPSWEKNRDEKAVGCLIWERIDRVNMIDISMPHKLTLEMQK